MYWPFFAVEFMNMLGRRKNDTGWAADDPRGLRMLRRSDLYQPAPTPLSFYDGERLAKCDWDRENRPASMAKVSIEIRKALHPQP
jgi:hypothetical protein